MTGRVYHLVMLKDNIRILQPRPAEVITFASLDTYFERVRPRFNPEDRRNDGRLNNRDYASALDYLYWLEDVFYIGDPILRANSLDEMDQFRAGLPELDARDLFYHLCLNQNKRDER